MSEKTEIQAIADTLKENFPRYAVKEAADFLWNIEKIRRNYKEVEYELSPVEKDLEQRIIKAFEGVTCHLEVRVLLGGEAEDEYMSPDGQALLSPLEERDDWQAIPDDLLCACDCALSYAGPHAYRFLIPRFMIGALHCVVQIFPGLEPDSEFELYTRGRMMYLTPEQQSCLTDFLNAEAFEENNQSRNAFLPWELDEYRATYAAEMSYLDYGKLLMRRFREKYAALLG